MSNLATGELVGEGTVRRVTVPKGGTVTFRATSKSGPPTADVHGIEEGIRKIKFLDQ